VFNLEVDADPEYVADGFLVHNCKSNCVCTFERTTLAHEPVFSPEPPMALNQLLPAEPCRERNRLAARKGVDAVPVRLYADRPPGALLAGAPGSASAEAKARLISSRGKMPADDAEALDRINAKLEGGKPLRADQVHVVYLEAANTNFVGDRHLFLGVSTLKNFAAEAEAGFAFMNSHRTGGLSAPSELPYGRTFAGRFETYEQPDGSRFSRALVGVYMLRGQRPNGANGPSTDDFHAGIQAGTIFDVSMGFYGGSAACDVCGADLADDDCPHVPGTTLAMTAEQVSAQEARGVPGGAASYTIEDGHAREVSAVYDGAVPGAGFRKALHLSRAGRLPAAALDQARRAYAPLAMSGDFAPAAPHPTNAPKPPGPRARHATTKGKPLEPIDLLSAYRFWLAAGQPEHIDLAAFAGTAAPPTPAPPAPTPPPTAPPTQPQTPGPEVGMTEQLARLTEQIQRDNAERERERRQAFETQINLQVQHWVERQLAPDVRTAVPAEKAPLTNLLLQLARDDAAGAAQVAYFQDGAAKVGSRLEAFQALWSLRGQHDFNVERVAARPGTGLESLRPDLGSRTATKDTPEYQQAAAWAERHYGGRANGTR
jgi:hypothetical protein